MSTEHMDFGDMAEHHPKDADEALAQLQKLLQHPLIKATTNLALEIMGAEDLYREPEDVSAMMKLVGRFIVQSKNRERAKAAIEKLMDVAMKVNAEELAAIVTPHP